MNNIKTPTELDNEDIEILKYNYQNLYNKYSTLLTYVKNHTSHRILICPECEKYFPYGFGCMCGHNYQKDRAYIEIINGEEVPHTVTVFNQSGPNIFVIEKLIPYNKIRDYMKLVNWKYSYPNPENESEDIAEIPTVEMLKKTVKTLISYIQGNHGTLCSASTGGFTVSYFPESVKYEIKFEHTPTSNI